ncbi:MAG: DUF3806 domain-containing protein [Planctomycetia bacterium]
MGLLSSVFTIFGCDKKQEQPEVSKPHEIRIDTPDGEVVAQATTVEPTPQTVTIVESDDLSWLQSLGADGPQFVSHYVPNVTEPSLKDYDAAFRAWQQDSSPPYTDQQVIQIIGGYLGNKCIADFDMEWVTVTDEYGTDHAVRSTKVEVMIFPFSTVLKRIEDKKYDFVHGVYYTLKESLKNGGYKAREK